MRTPGHSHREHVVLRLRDLTRMKGKNVFSYVTWRTRNSLLTQPVRGAVPTPIQYTISTPRNSTAGLQDPTYAISNLGGVNVGFFTPQPWTGNGTLGRSPCAWGATALRVLECKQHAQSSLARKTHCLQNWHLAPGSLAEGPGVVVVGLARILNTLFFSSSFSWISSVTSSSTPCAM